MAMGLFHEMSSSHHGIVVRLLMPIPMAMVVLKDGFEHKADSIEQELTGLVRNQIGAIACLKNILCVERLPKTRSGKILRKNLRQLVDGESLQIPSTIDDASIFDEISNRLTEKA